MTPKEKFIIEFLKYGLEWLKYIIPAFVTLHVKPPVYPWSKKPDGK